MGAEVGLFAFAVFQALVVIVLALFDVAGRRWFAIIGMILGFAVAISPFFLISGPDAAIPAVAIAVYGAAALIVAYGIFRKWKALVAAVVILAIPLACRAGYPRSPSSNAVVSFLSVLGEFVFLSGPIICALLGREIFDWIDRAIASRKAPRAEMGKL